MHDGQTIAPTAEGESSEGQTRTKYRLDKISWVDGLEEDCLNIGTLVTLIDSIMQHVGAKLTQYNVKGRTKVENSSKATISVGVMSHTNNKWFVNKWTLVIHDDYSALFSTEVFMWVNDLCQCSGSLFASQSVSIFKLVISND